MKSFHMCNINVAHSSLVSITILCIKRLGYTSKVELKERYQKKLIPYMKNMQKDIPSVLHACMC